MEKKNFKAIDKTGFVENVLLYIAVDTESSVRYVSDSFDSGIVDDGILYDSMQQLHKILDKPGIRLLCNCFRQDVTHSGMSRDSGQGIFAHKIYLGRPSLFTDELVNIFDQVPIEEEAFIVSYEEQEEFSNRWYASL